MVEKESNKGIRIKLLKEMGQNQRAEQNRTEQNKPEQNRNKQKWTELTIKHCTENVVRSRICVFVK